MYFFVISSWLVNGFKNNILKIHQKLFPDYLKLLSTYHQISLGKRHRVETHFQGAVGQLLDRPDVGAHWRSQQSGHHNRGVVVVHEERGQHHGDEG